METEQRTKSETISYLRQKIQKIEGFKADLGPAKSSIGLNIIDKAFPEGRFPLGVVHEFSCNSKIHAAPTLGFLSALMSSALCSDAPVLWITRRKDVFVPGLVTFGLQPHRIVFMSAYRDCEALWAMEEGLRTKGLSAVIAEVCEADLTATRRLQLATEGSGVTGFLIRVNPRQDFSSSCFASWKVAGLPSQLDEGLPGVGFPRWNVELRKIRNGTPGTWDLEWRGGKFVLFDKADKKITPKPLLHVRTA